MSAEVPLLVADDDVLALVAFALRRANFAERLCRCGRGRARGGEVVPRLSRRLFDGYRWASLEVTDLDPPTWFQPS
ncbi:MAG TPA: hypothetical protein VGL98_03030 [Gammaproteobacteria bacterium]